MPRTPVQRARDQAEAQSGVHGGTAAEQVSPTTFRLTFPGGESVELDVSAPDWHGTATTLQKTGRLYLLSLQFVLLLEKKLSTERVTALLASFMDYTATPEYQAWRVNNASWDHCVAMRVETLLTLSLRPSKSFRHLLSSPVLDDDLQWARTPENIPSNNHGLMLVRALLLARLCLRVMKDRRANAGDDVLHAVVPRILRDNFARDGWSAENSPLYSRVWYQLIEQMLKEYPTMLRTLGVSEYCTDILERLAYTTSVQMTPRGTYVPRGDTPGNTTGIHPPEGVHVSERVGIWVYHQDGTYLMATSGNDSPVHKHCDDTQVYLMRQGAEIFTDGGYHSYDYSDPRVKALRTPQAHSVATWAEESDLSPHKAFLHNGGSVQATLATTEVPHQVVMSSRRDDGGSILRTVTVESPRRVVLDDEWDGNRGRTPEATFLLGQEVAVDRSENQVRFTLDGVSTTMTFYSRVDIAVSSGSPSSSDGWRSIQNGVLLPTTRLAVRPRRRRTRSTTLRTVVQFAE
jgi:hypothetical protein